MPQINLSILALLDHVLLTAEFTKPQAIKLHCLHELHVCRISANGHRSVYIITEYISPTVISLKHQETITGWRLFSLLSDVSKSSNKQFCRLYIFLSICLCWVVWVQKKLYSSPAPSSSYTHFVHRVSKHLLKQLERCRNQTCR